MLVVRVEIGAWGNAELLDRAPVDGAVVVGDLAVGAEGGEDVELEAHESFAELVLFQ